MIKRYRKIPVEVEAVQLNASKYDSIRNWAGREFEKAKHSPTGWLTWSSYHGFQYPNENDYIIKNEFGELHCMSPEDFVKTYEEVE